MPDEMEEIISDFVTETQEILDSLDEKFVLLEKEKTNTGLLNEIFRGIHTVKGAAGFLGFQQIVELSHKTENLLKKLKDGLMSPEAPVMDVILRAVDLLKKLLDHVRRRDFAEEDISVIIVELERVCDSGTAPAESGAKKNDIPCGTSVITVGAAVAGGSESGPGQEGGDIENIQAEESRAEEAVKQEDVPGGAPQKKNEKAGEQTIRVDVERLDEVLNLVGELVLSRNRLMKITSKLEGVYPSDDITAEMREAMAFMDIITTDLQLAVMKTRMQPIKKIFSKFPRMVRDLLRGRGKEAELVISGEDTELDKSIIEEIGDPLVHLIRNAVDHGIEPPEDRVAAGKSPEGRLSLSASQQGNHIILTISDDGRGIDYDRLREKIVEKGFCSEEEAQRISSKELLEYIFLPGFSTAAQVSDISGRGVGMDVVKTNITKLNGFVEVKTEKGRGTDFIIKLPLTLAIIQVLMVEVGRNMFAIPLSSVIETVRAAASEIRTVKGQEVIKLRDEVIPVVRLGHLFAIDALSNNGADRLYLVVVAIGEKKFGIVVDRLQGQEEVVIKSIEGRISASDGIAGATITGEGRVVLIVDLSLNMGKKMRAALSFDK